MNLTEEQRKKIEENRRKALALRANKQKSTSDVNPPPNAPTCSFYKIQPNFPSSSLSSTKQPVSTNTINTALRSKPETNHTAYGKSTQFPNSAPKGSASGDTKVPNSMTSATQKKIDHVLGKDEVFNAKCVLLSRSRFCVEVKYFAPLIELFKSITSRQYDVQKKLWSFNLQDYKTLVKQINEKMRKVVTVEELPKSFVKTLNGSAADEKIPDADLSAVDEKLVGTLLPFQRQGVNFAIHHQGRVLLADDMGLGKTIQALCVAAYYRHEWPILIVVPSSVRFAWQQQILEWLPASVIPEQINVVLSGRDNCTSGLINIMSYDLMAKCHSDLLAKNFKVIIMDESHFLKSSKAVRTKKALPLLKKAKRVILLSGTPALSRPAELYTQLSVVDPKLFPNFHEYGIRYCNGKQLPWGWDFSGSSNLAELQIILEEKIMIRRLKKDVLYQLPSKYRTMVILDPSSVKTDRSMKASHDLVDKMQGNQRRGALLEYFSATGQAKTKAVREYVLDLLEAEHKFLVFAHHKVMLDAIEEAVIHSKYKYIRIDGSTTPEQRNFYCNKFQDNDEVRVAVLSILAANAGLNLTAASMVVFAELFWNPGVLVQAEDRVHRIGQEDSVNIQYLVARNTADDYIWPMIQEKLTVLSKAGLSKDDFDKAETRQLQDPKQKDILQYFDNDLFPDDDDEAFLDVVQSTIDQRDALSKSVPSTVTATVASHSRRKGELNSDKSDLNEMMADDSDATVDWVDSIGDITDFSDTDLSLEEPLTKRSKVN